MLENRTLLSSYLVTSTADGPGVITPSASPGIDFDASTLRGAITAANANPGADAISFDAPLAGQKILLDGSELPAIADDLTITGLGADQLTVDAQSHSRIFEIDPGATVGISGLTLTGGSTFDGGGIYNGGTLSVTNSTISGNSANHNGGGIYNDQSTLSITDSTISGNWTYGLVAGGGYGGGIYNGYLSMLSVTGSTISGNSTYDLVAGAGYGGGISNYGGTATVTGSTISGNSAVRAGGIYNSAGTASISDSTISGNTSAQGGGGIYNNYAILSVRGSTISGNTSAQHGGGIYSYFSTLSVSDSTISSNTCAHRGGGIYNDYGPLNVIDSTISGNSAYAGSDFSDGGGGIYNISGRLSILDSTMSGNSGAFGGGIYNYFSHSGTLNVIDSTISGNSADFGGGIYNYSGDSGTLNVIDSTISGNSAQGAGGGIYNYDSSGALSLTGSTIVANRTDSDGISLATFVGGGLAGSAAGVTLNNTIVAGNLRGTGVTPDDISWSSGTIAAASHNLIGDAATSGGITNGVNGNIVGVSDLTTVFVDVNHDGKIDASDLADNGGPTETYALAATSPAINAGDNSLAVDANGNPLQFDQRGEGFDRIVAGTVDIGAFELQPGDLITQINATVQDLFASGVINRGQQQALTLTLRDNPGDAGKVQALLNKTEAFVLGNVLTQQQANDLLDLGNVLLLELTTV